MGTEKSPPRLPPQKAMIEQQTKAEFSELPPQSKLKKSGAELLLLYLFSSVWHLYYFWILMRLEIIHFGSQDTFFAASKMPVWMFNDEKFMTTELKWRLFLFTPAGTALKYIALYEI